MRKAFALPTVAIAAAAFPLLTMTAASAHSGSHSYQADLSALNESGVTGTGMVTLDGTSATVTIEATGLVEGAPHAQHFHFGAKGACPTDADDKDGDGFVSVTEGAPFYGDIGASLTTKGDTSPSSALAVDRFPTAPKGAIHYDRRIDFSSAAVARAIRSGKGVIVIHGVDYNHNGEYDFASAGKSDLDPNLPAEATDPALCGVLR